MSRQKGRRPRPPRAEREARRQRYSQATRRERVKAPPAESTVTNGRRWTAIAMGTLALVVCFGALVTALIEEDNGNRDGFRTAAAFSAAMVPITLFTVTRISERAHPIRTAVMLTPLVFVGFFGIGGLLREPTTAVVASFGAAGAVALSAASEHRVRHRLAAVGIATLVTGVFAFTIPGIAVASAPLLPLVAVGLADRYSLAKAGAVPEDEAGPG